MGPAWAAWNKVIEERVSQTSRALSLAKSIKMVGLQASVSGRLQKLRLKEIASFKTVRRLAILTTVTGISPLLFLTPDKAHTNTTNTSCDCLYLHADYCHCWWTLLDLF